MLAGIGGKKVDITKEEFVYYKQIVGEIGGERGFVELFEVDDNGLITSLNPLAQTHWACILFIQNVMLNQTFRGHKRMIADMEKKINNRIDQLELDIYRE